MFSLKRKSRANPVDEVYEKLRKADEAYRKSISDLDDTCRNLNETGQFEIAELRRKMNRGAG